jgi:hypothetical protein
VNPNPEVAMPRLSPALLSLSLAALTAACGTEAPGYDPVLALSEPVPAALSGDFGPVQDVERQDARLTLMSTPDLDMDHLTVESTRDGSWVMVGLDFFNGLPEDALIPGRRVRFDGTGRVLSDTHPDAPPLQVSGIVCSSAVGEDGERAETMELDVPGLSVSLSDADFDAPAEETELEVVPGDGEDAPDVVEATITYDDGERAEASFPVPSGYEVELVESVG